MEKVALAKLVWMMALFYFSSFHTVMQNAARGVRAAPEPGALLIPTGGVLATADAIVAFALCAVGVVMTLRLDAPEPPSLRVT
jgi:hypothetical protein